MAWLPKSKKARRRLYVLGAAGAVLALAGVLVFFALGDAVSFFYTPSQAEEASVPAGRVIQLGGMVEQGSVQKHDDGSVEFVVTDTVSTARVSFTGDLPDLFREGQGVVTKGAFGPGGEFYAKQVLAKHDEKYMPRELSSALKQVNGGRDGSEAYDPSSYGQPVSRP